jgi:hypothetical protein
MPTIIDELIVQLKLDPKQFDEAQKAQVGKMRQFERDHERHSKKLSKDTDGLTQAFTVLQGRLLGIASLFLGGMGIQSFTEHITKLTVQTGYLAQSLGIGTAELAKWQGVGATVNATSSEMAQTITSVKNAFSDMKLGRPTAINQFSYATQQAGMGPPVLVNPQNDDPTKFLLDVSRWYVAQKDRGVASRLIQEKLGYGQGTLNALALGPETLSKRLKEMEKYAPSAAEVKNFQDLQVALATAATKAEALGRAILSFLTPGVIKFLETLSGITDTFRDKGASEGAKAIDDAASGGVGSVYNSVTGLGKSLWNRGKRALGFGGDDGGNANTEPGQTGGGVPATDATATGAGGGAAWLAQQRKPFAAELNNPSTRKLLGAVISSENPGAGPAVAESLMNRTMLVNKHRATKGLPPLTLRDMMLGTPSIDHGRSFYNPIRNGAIHSHLAKMNNPAFAEQMNRRIDMALAGSNVIRGYTDQGSRGDPNYFAGGVGININRERFNDWGYPGSRAFRAWIQHNYLAASAHPGASPGTTLRLSDEAANHPSDILLNGGLKARPFTFGAGAAMVRNGSITNNNRSSATHIGSMNVSVPPGADPDAYARGIRQRLDHYDNVQGANQGLL